MIDHRGPQLNYVTEPSEDLVTSSAHLVSLRRFVCAQGKNEAVSAQQVALVMCTFKNELVSTALSSLLKCRSFFASKIFKLGRRTWKRGQVSGPENLAPPLFLSNTVKGQGAGFLRYACVFSAPRKCS